jgi:hypothetical protein
MVYKVFVKIENNNIHANTTFGYKNIFLKVGSKNENYMDLDWLIDTYPFYISFSCNYATIVYFLCTRKSVIREPHNLVPLP